MSDDWDFYSARVDNLPASIFVDLGIGKEAPIRSHGAMAYVRVPMLHPRRDGLSSEEEFDALIVLEDRIVPKATQDGTAIFVGRNTSGGNRDFYFYVAEPEKFQSAIRLGMQGLPAYAYETGTREDREWQTYFNSCIHQNMTCSAS